MPAESFRRARERIQRICTSVTSARELRLAVLDALRPAVPFDAYVWPLTDPDTAVGTAPLADVPGLHRLPELIALKYATTINRWTDLRAPASLLASTSGHPEASPLWQNWQREYDVVDVASAVHRDRYGCWAFLDLWRLADAGPFRPADLRLLHDVGSAVTRALRTAQAAAFAQRTGHPVHPPSAPPGPLVLVLSADLRIRAQTPQTTDYLRVLVPPSDPAGQVVPAGAYNVGAQLLAFEGGLSAQAPRARMHLRDGVWLTMRAARMQSDDPANSVAVTIESSTPAEVLDIYCRSHALTGRETDIIRKVVDGSGTREVARALFLTENTVQHHLKSIYAKTSVRSRGELIGRVLRAGAH